MQFIRKAGKFPSIILLAGAILSSILVPDVHAATRDITLVNHEYEGTKQWLPGTIVVEEGDQVNLTLINNTPSGLHGFQIADYNVKVDVKKGETKSVSFKADKAGLFIINCQIHKGHVGGQLVVLKK